MKILFVSMGSLHFFRWTEQLQESSHQLYWFDILDGGAPVERLKNVHQITGWKLRYTYPGRYFIKSKVPWLYRFIQKFNTRNTAEVFHKAIADIQPDVVHSFALYVSCTPILSSMLKYPDIPWIYSSWGSDLFYFQNEPDHLRDIQTVLPRVNYMFSDCKRDYHIARKRGFDGKFLGVFPGGGGFHLEELNKFRTPFEDRKILLIKGFQGRSGRAIQVLKAIKLMLPELTEYKIVVFGADASVFEFAEQEGLTSLDNFTIHGRLNHLEVLQLMGEATLYIGNSNSDGMPNTLLEAICMGAFPIQSNPGKATEEIIRAGENGLLIEDCENVMEIQAKIDAALGDPEMMKNGVAYNLATVKPTLDYEHIRKTVLKKYDSVASALSVKQ